MFININFDLNIILYIYILFFQILSSKALALALSCNALAWGSILTGSKCIRYVSAEHMFI